MAEIIVNNDYRYKGMYQNYSASLDSNIDCEPTTTNSDSNKYVRINNINFYNSAALVTSSQIIFFIVSEQSGYFRFKYTHATSSYSYAITRSSGNGLFGPIADDFHVDTEAGVTIYYTDFRNFSNNNYSIVGLPIFNNPTDYVNYICNATTPPYNWQSVPSISGKNGILFLSTIQSVYLNNGDPVNNAPANYIQFADDSNVAILVGEQVDDPTLVTIQYIVPTGTYEYIKLVYKVDSAPTSITDGTAVDILQANRSVTISGIANGNTYFFKIFTDVSESEPYEFTTTKPPIASNYVFELDLSTDGKDIVRYDATKDIGNHKQGELYGSGISIEDGILTTSSWIYWDYDGTENPKFIPANCTLTFEYDTFFPNGEGYLDWYIIDSSGTQQIYWCFDTQHAFQSNKWYNCKTVAKVQNGKIVRYKYVLDGNEVSSNTADINMPCVNTETSLGISQIYFRLTRTTKFKNMSIYFDFSEYHDGGGSGSGSSGRA